MKKICIVGAAPLPNEKEGIREAAGLRTEQFFRPLQNQGHKIILIGITNKEPAVAQEKDGTTQIHRISRHDKNLHRKIDILIRQFVPDVCIGVNTYPAFVLSTVLPKNMPFWADLNGWIMAEAQARSWSEDSNSHFANALRQERQILAKADKISTVSERQKYCIIGELSTLGYLQKENFLEEKVVSIPNSTKFFDIDTPPNNAEDEKTLFRGKTVAEDAFVIAWIGGYNNWVDEKSLFEALEGAMKKEEKIRFVSTGGKIPSIAGSTFGRFQKRIAESKYSDRFIFLGWIETADMRKIYAESDIGINIDFDCAETQTGARNRINEMIKFGLPVLTTGGSEIGEAIGMQRAGITVPNGDVTAITKGIVQMARASKEEVSTWRQNGQYLSTHVFEETILTKPVQDFINTPTKTALKALPIQSPLFFLKNSWEYLKRNGVRVFLAKVWQRIF